MATLAGEQKNEKDNAYRNLRLSIYGCNSPILDSGDALLTDDSHRWSDVVH